MRVWTVGVGQWVGRKGRSGEVRDGCTLAQLEADLRDARILGAPDDARVIAVAPGSTHRAEVIWTTA